MSAGVAEEEDQMLACAIDMMEAHQTLASSSAQQASTATALQETNVNGFYT